MKTVIKMQNKVTHFVIPYSLVLGVDYKHLSTSLELGGKFYTRGKEKKDDNSNNADLKTKSINAFAIGLNVGYKF